MKKISFSLILKISGIVFLAFAVVLGNEIRLGIDRYIKNTLETDAEVTVRNLDKFAKSYIETVAVNKVDITSDAFQSIYSSALSGDNTKIKCLVDSQGKIVSTSREGVSSPTLCIFADEYYGSQSWPLYFNLTSLPKKDLNSIENFLIEHQKEVGNISIEVKLDHQPEEGEASFNDIQVKNLVYNDEIIYTGDVKGKTQTFQGTVSAYTSYNKEIVFFSSASGTMKIQKQTEKQDSSKEFEEKQSALVVDYQNAMNGLQYQIQRNFKKFKSSGKEFHSAGNDYSNYYLLSPYEYNGKYYSTVMMRLEDWSLLVDANQSLDYTTEESLDLLSAGYIFVTQEYTDLTMKFLQQFMVDNSSTYFLAFILIILICLSIAYMIVRPIRRIETTAKHIARKEFDYPIDMTRHDELGDLARSIDIMSKELEKTISNLHQEIERVTQLEGVRKDFVSNFTHEIKTPLGIINGFSELVELEQDEKKRNEYIDIIQNEAKRINELVLAMLDLSKLESQNISLTMEDVDLLDIVDESLDSMAYLLEKKNIHLNAELDSATIHADHFKIEMVINNFISNALRYTEDGKSVYVHLDEHCFEVENEGAQIPNDEVEKIWLTFHKVDKARNEEGTGLGLAICKAILDLHHFEYGVKNTDKGVLFYFKF